MSLSKEHLPVGDSEHPRKPKCTRCRHHGIIIPQKGHVRFCPFVRCDCCKCSLVSQRTRLTALQRSRKKDSNQPQRKRQRAAVSPVEPAAEGVRSTGARSTGAREDDAGLSAAVGAQGPPRDGAPGRTAATGPSDGAPGRTAPTGSRDGAPGRVAATGPRDGAPGRVAATGSRDGAPGRTAATGSRDGAPGRAAPTGSRDGAPGRAAATRSWSLDIQSRAAAGRPTSAGWDGGKLVPFVFSDEEPGARFRNFGELGQAAALPVLHVPWMPDFPGVYGPCPSFLLSVLWAPPALYGAGPPMFPRFEPAALHYPPPPPPPPPPADRRPVFFALRPSFEAPREEAMSRQHAPAPPWDQEELDVEELDVEELD